MGRISRLARASWPLVSPSFPRSSHERPASILNGASAELCYNLSWRMVSRGTVYTMCCCLLRIAITPRLRRTWRRIGSSYLFCVGPADVVEYVCLRSQRSGIPSLPRQQVQRTLANRKKRISTDSRDGKRERERVKMCATLWCSRFCKIVIGGSATYLLFSSSFALSLFLSLLSFFVFFFCSS